MGDQMEALQPQMRPGEARATLARFSETSSSESAALHYDYQKKWKKNKFGQY